MKKIDALFTQTIDGITCCRGHAIPLGATLLGENQINFSINSVDAESCTLERITAERKLPMPGSGCRRNTGSAAIMPSGCSARIRMIWNTPGGSAGKWIRSTGDIREAENKM